jgi:hypothetical protein
MRLAGPYGRASHALVEALAALNRAPVQPLSVEPGLAVAVNPYWAWKIPV